MRDRRRARLPCATAMPAPWRLLSATRVRYYIADTAARAKFLQEEAMRDDEFAIIVGELMSKHSTKEGGTSKAYASRGRKGWQLFEHAHWIQCVERPERIFCIGPDVDFFVEHVAHQHHDMKFFKADRLRRFVTGTLFASSKLVSEYTGRSKEASTWKVIRAPPDALDRVVSVLPPSPFAEPPATLSAAMLHAAPTQVRSPSA